MPPLDADPLADKERARKADSITPTLAFIRFSGTRVRGARRTTPSTITATSATTAPTTAPTRCPTPPRAITISTTSTPSSSTPLNAVETATQCSRVESFAWTASNSSASSCNAFRPAARRIALCSQRSPKSSRKIPTTTWASATGKDRTAAPSTITIAARTTAAIAVPVSADHPLQPLNNPTASTIVNASTHSTPEARKVERMTSGLTPRRG